MNTLLSASTRAMILPLIVFLSGSVRSIGAEGMIVNVQEPPSPTETRVSSTTAGAPDAQSTADKHLPRYYLGGYTRVDEKGSTQPVTDPVQIDDYVHQLKKWIPDRILESVPTDCTDANPCEELQLREETVGIEVILVTEIRQKPVVYSTSKILHIPIKNETAKKDSWLKTRSCLAVTASYSINLHDKLHRNSQ